MSEKIIEAMGLIQQAISENTRTVATQQGYDDVDVELCQHCSMPTDTDYGGHAKGCFVGWLQEALSILDDLPPNSN